MRIRYYGEVSRHEPNRFIDRDGGLPLDFLIIQPIKFEFTHSNGDACFEIIFLDHEGVVSEICFLDDEAVSAINSFSQYIQNKIVPENYGRALFLNEKLKLSQSLDGVISVEKWSE